MLGARTSDLSLLRMAARRFKPNLKAKKKHQTFVWCFFLAPHDTGSYNRYKARFFLLT
jgi:hypothetical protein